jgi:pimeloyl-ACP methyl ester carboxylesterase
MAHAERIEDRVFGRSELYPPAPLDSRPSAAYDLFSVSVEGSEVAYASQGTIVRPPLVFIHGWGAFHKYFRNCFSAFSPRWRCIAPDLPGHGLSARARCETTVEGYAAWLGRFLDALGIARATLVGHSMGGTIGLLFALDHPERVEKLAVVNPPVRGSTAFSWKSRFKMMPLLRDVLFWLARNRWIRRRLHSGVLTYSGALDRDLSDDIDLASRAALKRAYASLRAIDLVPRLGGLAMPTLAVGSDSDRIVLGEQYLLIPGAEKARIPLCGHIPMVERPAEFACLLDAFLRQVLTVPRRGTVNPYSFSSSTEA